MSATHAVSPAASAGRLTPRVRARSANVGHVSSKAMTSARGVMGVSTAGLSSSGKTGRRAGSRSRSGVVYARVETRGTTKTTGGISDMTSQVKQMRAQMEEDEDLNTLMAGLRGTNIDDSDFAADGVTMQVVDVESLKAAGDDELPLYYDSELIAAYWSKRPAATAQRVVQLLSIAGGFITGIVSDIVLKKTEENSVKRAIQLRDIVTSLGPAYIKLGQALSNRPDILSPDAMTELQKLCDKVPSFDNKVAFDCLEAELGCKWQDVYSSLGSEPVAAASLGQVYKGVLKTTGETVAVKVQRPAVLETVSIDLYIIRKLGMALREVESINTDVVALLDEWAERFFEELDYVKEGENATKFAASIKDDLPQVVVPRTYAEFTRRKVITSEWIDGEKLSQSTADDVGDLVNIGVICYLKQLLDTGFFHADPHPGNLIRTPDGRLAILDFGLMTDIDDNIKFGMIEAIAHLIHRDYEAIVEDFVTLDFIPEGVDLKPILPPLSRVFDTALEGGGAKNINFQEVAADLAQITFDYPFRIPPYFALIIRAIGVLEGIALVGNPDFALVDEAYPYISKRLLTDDSPRLRASLRYMVYGKGQVFDADRLIDVLEAFETFRVASRTSRGNGVGAFASAQEAKRASSVGDSSSPSSGFQGIGFDSSGFDRILGSIASLPGFPFPGLAPSPFPNVRASGSSGIAGDTGDENAQAREALQFVLSPEGSFFRDFLLDEAVKGIDALGRDNAATVLKQFGLGDVRVPLFFPGSLTPARVRLSPNVTAEDRATVESVTKLLNFLLRGSRSDEGAASGDPARTFRELGPLLPAVATEVLPELINRLNSRVAARTIRDVFGEQTDAIAAPAVSR
jgi:aarF domain-containing kinase